MKTKRILISVLIAAAALVMIAAGLHRVYRVYQHYRADMLAYESRHLGSIVDTTAGSLNWMMSGYEGQLSMLLGRLEFAAAEESYAATGDPEVMQRLLSRRDVGRIDMRYSVAVYDNGVFIAASDSRYPIPSGGDEALGSLCVLRKDSVGVFWFVFSRISDQGYEYELAVPVYRLFSYQANTARVGRSGYLFMMDREQRFFICSNGRETGIFTGESLIENFEGVSSESLTSITDEPRPEDGYYVFRYPWSSGAAEETIVVTTTLTMEADGLIIGAAMSFSEFDSFLSDTLHEVTWIILLEISGAFLLFLLAAWIMIDNRKNALELQVVRERVELMEEINRQQQSLYHTERLQQLGVMTSGIVHEFNNMLTPIMSQSMLLLEQLADRDDSPEFESALDIYEASEKAREVLRRMSILGKKDLGMDFKTIDLGALLHKTMNLVSMAKDSHIQLELSIPDMPLWTSGNEQLLTQAFLNLCINGCQAMGSDGTLTLTAERQLRSGRPYAVVTVKDTGPGIPEEALDVLYDPFFTTKGEKGTGLGLAICKKIIETHKGTIKASNSEDAGAVFTVTLPMTEQPEAD